MRALYKKPQLLILDEFTSALDRNTEDFVLKLINKLKSEIAILIFSHRLQSLPKIADSIHVLEKGKITAHGTHETLLKSKNFYSDFWEDLETILKRKQ
jgi:ABC-type multidrug transport system fused ATPase/permease subunit